MILIGVGQGAAFGPLTAAGVAGATVFAAGTHIQDAGEQLAH